MTIKDNPGLKEFLIRLGTTTAAVVLIMYLAKVWFVDPRLAVLSLQELTSEQVDTAVKTEEEALKPVVKVEEKEIKSVSVPRPLAVPTKVISWRDAAKYYGEHGTVEGRIVATKNTGKVCFLNFDPDWKTTFTAVIFAKRFSAFPPNPENYYLNKRVRVTGYIKEYRGRGGKYAPKPEIILEDPSQIEIVKAGTPSTYVSYQLAPAVTAGKININTATQAQLETLPRIGPKTAQAIIANRPFKSIEEITKVPRIGPKTYQKLKDSITVSEVAALPATPTTALTAPVKLVIKKVDTDGDGIPDTFILTGEVKKKPVSLAKAKAIKPDLIEQPYLIKATCVMIYDGDSIQVKLADGSLRKIRLVGIDTPEVWRKTGTGWAEDPEPGAKKASKFTKKEVPVGQTIYLDVDDEEPEDHYGRMLALVYTNLPDVKKGPRYSLNAKLLQKGLARVLFIPPSEFDPYSWK